MKEACLYRPLDQGQVQCLACAHFCVLADRARGRCGVRENQGGILVTLVYDRVVAAAVDPIEKKPIFHLHPGSLSFSVATVGCNLTCRFCQNADIAQYPGREFPGKAMTPAQIVTQAQASGCRSIAFTYTEPTVYVELALDTARLAREKGLYTIFVTNGFMGPALVDLAAPVLTAANVDLKAFTETFYKDYCGARLLPVKQSLVRLKEKGVMVEVTTLVIPGLNDDTKELEAMARFIARDLGPETPWHLSRFHPAHHLTDRGPTPRTTLEQAWQIGRDQGLFHVYTGNLSGGKEETRCTGCGQVLVRRQGYRSQSRVSGQGACPDCKTPLYGIY